MNYLHIETNKYNDIYTEKNATASLCLNTAEVIKWLSSKELQELPEIITVGIDCRVPEKARQRYYNAMMKRANSYAKFSGKSIVSIETKTFIAVDGKEYEKTGQYLVTLK